MFLAHLQQVCSERRLDSSSGAFLSFVLGFPLTHFGENKFGSQNPLHLRLKREKATEQQQRTALPALLLLKHHHTPLQAGID